MNKLVRIKAILLDLLFPCFCMGCKKEGSFLCQHCRSLLKTIPPTCFVCHKLSWPSGRTCDSCRPKTAIYAFLSPFSYGDEAIKELIHHLKYNRVRGLAEILADLLKDYLQKYKIWLPKEALLIPIPLHKTRQRERGFNQTELIAKVFTSETSLILAKDVLIKTKPTKSQIELSSEERRKNLSGVFTVSKPQEIQGKTIILLDDVKTTGTTLEEAATTLKSAGAKRVWAMTVAH
ncbi:MAG: ComF family protein [bacterium]|nr:ComF family protein [bacterium]